MPNGMLNPCDTAFLPSYNPYGISVLTKCRKNDNLKCTQHIELLLLDEENIKVTQYLTAFPDKQWFVEKLNKSIAIAQQNAKYLNAEK